MRKTEPSPRTVVQRLKLYWEKACRGAPYASQRRARPQALPLPKDFFGYHPFGLPVHFVYAVQDREGIGERRNQRRLLPEKETIQVGAAELLPRGDRVEAVYRYDWHRGRPARPGYNPDTRACEKLRETAFPLGPGEYGRMVYNGRFTDWDTGAWYYEEEIVNVLLWEEGIPPLDCFLQREPDRLYRQIAILK